MIGGTGPMVTGGGAMLGTGGGAMVAGGGVGVGPNGGAVAGGGMVGITRDGRGGLIPPASTLPAPAPGGACCAVPGGGACSVFSNENCGAACGVKSGCCDGGGAQFGWVGPYAGSYTTETQYRYVGYGLGEFDYVKPAPSYCICIVSSSVILLLLILLGYFFLPQFTQTTTPLPPPVGPAGYCVVFGDPHIQTFDGAHADYYTPGEFWIVKSDTVQIQGRYRPTHVTNGLSVMKEIAIGGQFMDGKTIIVTATTATFGGQPILTGFPSNFDGATMGMPGVSARLDSQGELLQNGRDQHAALMRVVHLTLPRGVNVQINRWTRPEEGTYINAKIAMPRQPNQDGHCGNFNGNSMDDARIQVRARVGTTGVAQNEMLFAGAKLPVGQSTTYDINNCPKPKLDQAKRVCGEKFPAKRFAPPMSCLIDVCVGGAGFAAEE